MVSDVLSDAVDQLDSYLNNQFYDDWYTGKMRADIIKVRDEMARIRRILDTPPKGDECPRN
jgi:hypothetical protein